MSDKPVDWIGARTVQAAWDVSPLLVSLKSEVEAARADRLSRADEEAGS